MRPTKVRRVKEARALVPLSQGEEKMERKFLSAEEILGAQDIKVVDVDVPEWDGSIRLRTMTAAEAMRLSGEDFSNVNSSVAVLILTAVNPETNKPLFTLKDVDVLKEKSMAAFMRIQKAAAELNGMTDLVKGKELAETKNG
jgi:hypothetical protein